MHWVVTLAAATGGALLAERLRLPGGLLLGAMVGSALVTLGMSLELQAPFLGTAALFVAVGVIIGTLVTRDRLNQLAPMAGPAAVPPPSSSSRAWWSPCSWSGRGCAPRCGARHLARRAGRPDRGCSRVRTGRDRGRVVPRHPDRGGGRDGPTAGAAAAQAVSPPPPETIVRRGRPPPRSARVIDWAFVAVAALVGAALPYLTGLPGGIVFGAAVGSGVVVLGHDRNWHLSTRSAPS